MQNRSEPATRPAYLLAAVLIWTAIIASLAAGPPPAQVRLTSADCVMRR